MTRQQLAVISLTAGGSSRWAVFAGASLALVASTGLAVLVGEGLLRLVKPAYLQMGAAALFLIVGALVGAEALRSLR